jgi:hypothetical protein
MSREMDIPRMGQHIVQHMDNIFTKKQLKSPHLVNLKTLCELFEPESAEFLGTDFTNMKTNLSSMSSPNFYKSTEVAPKKISSQTEDFLTSEIFLTKYSAFIKIIYASIRLGLKIFATDGVDSDVVFLQSNINLVNSINNHKRKLIDEHTDALCDLHTQIGKVGQAYDEYLVFNTNFLTQMKTLDRIHNWIQLYAENSTYHMSDNLIEPLIVFFQVKKKVTEKYSCKKK